MSYTLTITGNTSVLQCEFVTPLILGGDYECGLLYFSTFNTIPNIHDNNNIFAYGKNKKIQIPFGTYDLFDLEEYLQSRLNDCRIKIRPNNNTLKCSVFCTQSINFEIENSIGSFLGFSKTILEPHKWHESTHPLNIIPVSVVRIECDFIQGSYTNGSPTHIIHEFLLNIPPGHQLIEVPKNIIYFPIRKNDISIVTVKILDLEGKLIDFRNENIQLSLHIRKTK